MKTNRLIGILTTLLNNDKIKAKNLAEKFEVSIRTIYRDVENLCIAGIPIITCQGGDGGIRIAEGYKLDKSILTNTELTDILIGLKSIESISTGINVKLLLDKLTPKQDNFISVSNNIFIDLSSFYKTSLSHKIRILRESMVTRVEVNFDYFSNKGISKRYVEPYFITFKWSSWYLFGYCKSKADFRLFKLNRMNNLKAHGDKFTIRDIPSERAHLDNYFNENLKRVTLLLDPALEYVIVENYGVDSYEITKENRIKFILEYSNQDFAIQSILAFGDKAEVISPQHIIDEIKTHAQNILSMYK